MFQSEQKFRQENMRRFLTSNLLCLRRTALIERPFHTGRNGLSGFSGAPSDAGWWFAVCVENENQLASGQHLSKNKDRLFTAVMLERRFAGLRCWTVNFKKLSGWQPVDEFLSTANLDRSFTPRQTQEGRFDWYLLVYQLSWTKFAIDLVGGQCRTYELSSSFCCLASKKF